MLSLVFLIAAASAQIRGAGPLSLVCNQAFGDDLGHRRGQIQFWYNSTFADPARTLDEYLAQSRFHPDPCFLGDLFRPSPPPFGTLHNPEFDRVLRAVQAIHVGLLTVNDYALGPVFAQHPDFAEATLNALREVVLRLRTHLRSRRGFEARHLAESTERCLNDLGPVTRR